MIHKKNLKRRLYGRRKSRPLGQERQEALDALLPALEIPEDTVKTGTDIDPATFFKHKPSQMWLEIGFGNGEHLAGLMKRHPDYAFIGAEPFLNGMAAFLKDIQDEKHDHVRVWMDDALLLLDTLSDNCLDGIYVLNPDPWPKKRHHKRRIINHTNLDQFSRVMKPGAELIMTSDVVDLAEWMVTQAGTHPDFEWTAEHAVDWGKAPADWMPTRYEQKGISEGRQQYYLLFRKKI